MEDRVIEQTNFLFTNVRKNIVTKEIQQKKPTDPLLYATLYTEYWASFYKPTTTGNVVREPVSYERENPRSLRNALTELMKRLHENDRAIQYHMLLSSLRCTKNALEFFSRCAVAETTSSSLCSSSSSSSSSSL